MSGPLPEREYPRDLESSRKTKSGLRIFLRPVRSDDAPIYRVFLESLSNQSVYLKFFRSIQPTEEFAERLVDVDYVRRMTILAFAEDGAEEEVLGMGRYILNEDESTAEVYFAVRDDHQNLGIGGELVSYLTKVAKKRGLKGFTAQVMVDNRRMLHLFRSFEGTEFKIQTRMEAGVFYVSMEFL